MKTIKTKEQENVWRLLQFMIFIHKATYLNTKINVGFSTLAKRFKMFYIPEISIILKEWNIIDVQRITGEGHNKYSIEWVSKKPPSKKLATRILIEARLKAKAYQLNSKEDARIAAWNWIKDNPNIETKIIEGKYQFKII
jgi:hypothetical protein